MANTPKSNSSSTPQNHALQFFLAGCAAEIYLLVLRHFYVNGTLRQVVAWDSYLNYFIYGGAALLVAGLILVLVRKKLLFCPTLGWWVLGAGVFLTGASVFVRIYYSTALSLLCVVVPVVMVLSILWGLYDRECSWSLTILSFSLVALWVARRGMDSLLVGTLVRIGVVVSLLLVLLVAFLAFRADHSEGKVGKFQLLPEDADVLPIYVSCALSVVGLVFSFFSMTVTYYLMWTMGIVLFALAVYYTVKQL